VALGLALLANILHFWLTRLRGPLTLERRALWLHGSCRRVVRSLGIRCLVEGHVPTHGLVASNHLSHLDILIYGSVMPCFFVSKIEVDRWPYFGRAARSGGTVFIDRSRRTSASAGADEIATRLALAMPVLLFPEGTSTDGVQVLRFYSGLFEPAIAAAAPITPAAIRYVLDGNAPERELCWYGDMLFLPHLWKVQRMRGFTAQIHFGEPQVFANRRLAAHSTHEQVAAMRQIGKAAAPAQSIASLSRTD
jgi:lyso-ornithine lipid O-acyltransferase